MAQQAAILCILIFFIVPIAFSGRALLEAPAATPAAAAAALLQPPPPLDQAPAAAAGAVVFLPPPPAPAASVVLHPPAPPLPGGATSAIPLHQPADADHHHPAAATSYHIHFTKIGLLGVLVPFLAGCFLCALFIVYVARSTTRAPAANGPAGEEVGGAGGGGDPAMENAALRCLSCVARVAAFV